LRNEAVKLNPNLSVLQAERLIYKWATESGHSVENSQQFVQWACHSVQEIAKKLQNLRLQYIRDQTILFCGESSSAVLDGLQQSEAMANHTKINR